MLFVEYNKDVCSLLTATLHGYASVFVSQAFVIECILLTFKLEAFTITININYDVYVSNSNSSSNSLDVAGVVCAFCRCQLQSKCCRASNLRCLNSDCCANRIMSAISVLNDTTYDNVIFCIRKV